MHIDRALLTSRGLWAAVAALLVASAVGLGLVDGHERRHVEAAGPPARTDAGRTAARGIGAVTTTTPAPAPTTLPPTTNSTPAPAAKPAPAPRPPRRPAAPRPAPAPPAPGLAAYTGMGTWVDTYDWSGYKTNGNPPTGVADIDRMAELGVQTLYIQASTHDAPADIPEPERLLPMLRRAKAKGMRVVAWYLPTLVDPAADLRRMVAISKLTDVDTVAVDIEARNVSDVQERNRRLVEFSRALRQAVPGRAIGAIVLPAVVLEVINRNYWPDFPYKEIAPFYDVWLPMGYWTNRTQSSGYRDAYRYTKENVDRLRAGVGKGDIPVHVIGGIGDQTTPADVAAFRRAALDTRSIGGSIYDWRTTRAECWPGMVAFRA